MSAESCVDGLGFGCSILTRLGVKGRKRNHSRTGVAKRQQHALCSQMKRALFLLRYSGRSRFFRVSVALLRLVRRT